MWASACMLPFTTVAIAVFNKQTECLVRCDGTKVLKDAVESVLVVELEGGWLWLLVVAAESVEVV